MDSSSSTRGSSHTLNHPDPVQQSSRKSIIASLIAVFPIILVVKIWAMGLLRRRNMPRKAKFCSSPIKFIIIKSSRYIA